MKWTLVVNPKAGMGKVKRKWAKIQQCFFEHNIEFEYYFTSHKGHGIQLTRDLARKGRKNFVAVGGDGMLNEVINGIFELGDSVAKDEFVVACLPLGSGCDWARTHQVPTSIEEAVLLLKDPVLYEHDIGKATYGVNNVRYFINVAGVAFDAFVVEVTESLPSKGLFGKFSYLVGLIISLKKYRSPAFSFVVEGRESLGNFFCLNIGICRYSGGGMALVPDAVPDDGLFDITIIEKMSPLQVIINLRYLFNGRIYNHEKVAFTRVRQIEILPVKENIPLEVDGEYLGAIPAKFSVLEEQLKVVVGR